jgi:hypothetical protein
VHDGIPKIDQRKNPSPDDYFELSYLFVALTSAHRQDIDGGHNHEQKDDDV